MAYIFWHIVGHAGHSKALPANWVCMLQHVCPCLQLIALCLQAHCLPQALPCAACVSCLSATHLSNPRCLIPLPSTHPPAQLAHIALDRSLRPTLLGTWLLRYLEEGEAGVQQHTVNIHALSAAEILEVHGSEALPRLAAMWGSTQLLTELVQQEEVGCWPEL